MSHLTAENAGIALSYAEWPGRTRLLIPLGHTANGQPSAGVTPGQAGEVATSGQAGGAATFRRSGSAGTNGTGAGGAIAPGGTGSAAQAGGTGVMSGTNSGAAGAAGSRIEGGATASASPAAGAPATSSESKGVSSKTAAPGASREETGSLGRFLFAGGLRWLILFLLVLVAILALLAFRILRAGLSPAWAVAVLRSVREGHPLVEMVVNTQNRRIGMRNVHYLPRIHGNCWRGPLYVSHLLRARASRDGYPDLRWEEVHLCAQKGRAIPVPRWPAGGLPGKGDSCEIHARLSVHDRLPRLRFAPGRDQQTDAIHTSAAVECQATL